MLCDAPRSTLILIDYQDRLMPVIQHGDSALANAARLASLARRLDIPVAVTRQVPAKLGDTAESLRSDANAVFDKTCFDATVAADFSTFIKSMVEQNRSDFIIAGCETHVCVLQTVLSLLTRKHQVKVVADACGSRRQLDAALAFERVRSAGAELVTTEMVLFEWLRHSDHSDFRDMQASIK